MAAVSAPLRSPAAPRAIHPLWLRLMHWTNALAFFVMLFSGWRIYNASPLFDFRFPKDLTLGGWLGGALQWHFAAMWLLAFNGLLYLGWSIATGRLQRKLLSISPRALVADVRALLGGKLGHDDLAHYNQIQKLAYVSALVLLVLIVLSGLAVWKSVQLPLLRDLMGGYEGARLVHFVAMAGLVGFVVVHVVMATLVPKTILAMLRGR
jgi:thiosulfate reductase cytochrome b subunit